MRRFLYISVITCCPMILGSFAAMSQVADTVKKAIPAAVDTSREEHLFKDKLSVKEETKEGESGFPLDNFYADIKKRPLSFLRIFRFSLSTGYGNTFFSHELSGYGIYQAPGQAPTIFPGATPTTRYSNWVNERVLDNSANDPAAFLVLSDTTKLGFTGNAANIPIKATIHFEFMKRYRIGIGYSYEYMSIGKFSPTNYANLIGTMTPTNSSGFMSRFFGLEGVSFYRTGNYLFTGDLQIGSYSPGNFDQSLATTGVYVNAGVTVERELSEYLRLFVRPSYEIKSYTLNLPEGGSSIAHSMNALNVNIGISYRIPELPKCFKADCRIQINHAHGNKEYRSRVHPIYKKQNPNYGENHPELIKYKGKNKKMLNPY